MGFTDEIVTVEEPAEESVEELSEEPATERRGIISLFRRRPEARSPSPAPSPAATRRPAARRTPDQRPLFEMGDPEPITLEMLDRAIELANERGRASVVLFQRRLQLGFHRARAVVDRLVELGALGDLTETGSHPVLVDDEAWSALRRELA